MRGIGISFSRLFSPKAIIAGAAILAGTAAPGLHADAQEKAATENRLNDQRAYAVPRSDPESGNGFAFPQPLNPSDAVLVRHIFALQSHGNIAAAEEATRQLSNRILLGTILADRYIGPYDKPSAPQLIRWLKLYGDQPQAPAIENVLRLRLRGKSRSASALPKISTQPYLAPPDPSQSADLDMGPADEGVTRQAGLDARVLGLTDSGKLDDAVRIIAAARIDPLYGATLRAEVARTAFAEGRNGFAARLARGGRAGMPRKAWASSLRRWPCRFGDWENLRQPACLPPPRGPPMPRPTSPPPPPSGRRAARSATTRTWITSAGCGGRPTAGRAFMPSSPPMSWARTCPGAP